MSTMMSFTDKSHTRPSVTARLPPQGQMTLTRQGVRLPFVPKNDERFWGSMMRFYDDFAGDSVNAAKDEAKKACLLVMAELDMEDGAVLHTVTHVVHIIHVYVFA